MSDILLSICIPTYKRAGYLKNCLNAFLSQLSDKNKHLVEIYVSNNASPDNTTEVVNQYLAKGHEITYHINSENIGPDNNVASCFTKAKGKYVWVFADDDYLLPGCLNPIIEILQINEIGILYLNSLWYDDEKDLQIKTYKELNYTVYNDPISFFKQVHYWITFASGNIVNRKSLESHDWAIQFKESNLIQLSWMIPAIFYNKINIYVDDQVLACKANNSGGYKFYTVFGKNFNMVMDFFIKNGIDKRIKTIINDNLLVSYFPHFIKNRPGEFDKENYFKVLFPVFWNNKFFWKNIVPLLFQKYTSKISVTRVKNYFRKKVTSHF